MKNLKDILYKVSLISTIGDMDIAIENICFDSREITKQSLFVAINGTQSDGHSFIDSAIDNGASCVVCENFPSEINPNITYIQVVDSSKSLGIISSNFYDSASKKIRVIGVTGTNGKTTIVNLLYSLYKQLGYRVGMLSTIKNYINDKAFPASHTTPNAIKLNEFLSKMVKDNCSYCFMEVSSHALTQFRVEGIEFHGAIFTNITHDHLDYHVTFDAYIKAKKILFDNLSSHSFALINIDDKNGKIMIQNTKAKIKTYARKRAADFNAKLVSNTPEGIALNINTQDIWFRLIGIFNLYNLLSVYACAVIMGESNEKVLTILSTLNGIEGRFERISSSSKVTAIVDYAHTPDALSNVLETITNLKNPSSKIITVIGCGGDRDTTKRPLIGSIASKKSDKVILTTDNPRYESAQQIIENIKTGIKKIDLEKVIVKINREEAIKFACLMANEDDIILVAGKGHEKYQEIKGIKHPFNDKEILSKTLNLLSI